jgi:hypothetical protein
LQERVLEYWSPAPLPEGQQGKEIDPPTGLVKPAEGVLDFATDSSNGSESEEVVEVAGPAAGGGVLLCAWCQSQRHQRGWLTLKVGALPLQR